MSVSERDKLIAAQVDAVMPMIGPLLDAWEGLPNDVRGELGELDTILGRINAAMENPEDSPAEDPARELPARYCPQCRASGDKVGEAGSECWTVGCEGVIASGLKAQR